MQPGSTITPGREDGQNQAADERVLKITHDQAVPDQSAPEKPLPTAAASPIEPAEPVGQPAPTEPVAPVVAPVAQSTSAPQEIPVNVEQDGTSWQYNPETAPSPGDSADHQAPSLKPISWTASEFIDHQKDKSWFLGLAGLTLLAIGVIYFMTHDITSCAVIGVVAVLFGITAARKPRTLEFAIDDQGIQIGNKLYTYASFKSFTVMEEGPFSSIQLLPMQRFMPPVSLYYPPEQEDAITASLGAFLPHENRERDPIDKLMRRIRF